MFKDIDKFREAAIFFNKNKRYTNYPKGTLPFKEYWEQEHFKCMVGVEIDGVRITGPHYFYLNYTKILCTDEETNRARMMFPRFLDIDYDYFHIVERAKVEKKGVILVKPRRTGFSYKNAALVTHEYNFYRDARCIIGSFRSTLSENTMGMVLDNMNFLDKNTEWRKQRNPDTKDFVKARYKENIGGIDVWKGYNSQVQTLTFKDNPFASVGKLANLFIFEEAGTFENLISSYNITEPCWKDGENTRGIPIVFGTGGDMEGGTKDFHQMFYDPEKYNLLSFDNIWEEGKQGTKCGWFLPATRGRLGDFNGKPLVDKDGNSNEELALESIKLLRTQKIGKSGNINDTITQYPLTPSEAFLRKKGNIFPTIELSEWLAEIETKSKYKNIGKKGELYFDIENKIKFKLDPDLEEITNFPVKDTDSKDGCVVIYEEPEQYGGQIPYGLYIAGCDPYDQDKSQTDSLGSFFVYKTFITANKTSNIIVAEYTGRPEFADTFYENCRKLCMYYNAKCLYENQLKGLKTYFEIKRSTHYLYEQPGIIKDIVKDSRVNRGYGIHMNRGTGGASGIKDQCEIYLKQWLLEEKSGPDDTKILNLHTIFSQGLLKELIRYDRDGNFDRVIAFMLCILQQKENHKIHIEENVPTYMEIDKFFTRQHYKKYN